MKCKSFRWDTGILCFCLWVFLFRMRCLIQYKGVFGGTCLSQGVSAKLHVLKCLQGVKHLGKAAQKSQQTFCNACPDRLYNSFWNSLVSAKAKPVAREFTILAENVVCYPSTSHCSCAALWDNS